MGGRVSTLAPEDIQDLQHCSHFSEAEIGELYRRFRKLDKDQSGSLSADELLSIPEFAMNPLAPTRLIPLFMTQVNDSMDRELWLKEARSKAKEVSLRGFIKILSVFHARASPAEKLLFAFRVFDTDNDGAVGHEEIGRIVELMAGPTLSPDERASIAAKTVRTLGSPADGIAFEPFLAALSAPGLAAARTLTVPFRKCP